MPASRSGGRGGLLTRVGLRRIKPGPTSVTVAALLCLLIGLMYLALQIRTVFSDQLKQEYAGLVLEAIGRAQSARNEAGIWLQASARHDPAALDGYRHARVEFTHRLALLVALVNASPGGTARMPPLVSQSNANANPDLAEADSILADAATYWRAQRDAGSADMHARINRAAHVVIALAALLFCMLLTALGMYARRHRQLAGQSQEFEHAALHDPMTGLPNRRNFFATLEAAATHHYGGASASHGMAVLFVDLDGFKQVNDTLGHHVGDEFLSAVSRQFRDSVRKVDMVARMGGDEFAVLIPAFSTQAELEEIARRLIECVVRTDGQMGMGLVRASIGIASFPEPVADYRRLLAAADAAMYEVKRRGKNGFAFATTAG